MTCGFFSDQRSTFHQQFYRVLHELTSKHVAMLLSCDKNTTPAARCGSIPSPALDALAPASLCRGQVYPLPPVQSGISGGFPIDVSSNDQQMDTRSNMISSWTHGSSVTFRTTLIRQWLAIKGACMEGQSLCLTSVKGHKRALKIISFCWEVYHAVATCCNNWTKTYKNHRLEDMRSRCSLFEYICGWFASLHIIRGLWLKTCNWQPLTDLNGAQTLEENQDGSLYTSC